MSGPLIILGLTGAIAAGSILRRGSGASAPRDLVYGDLTLTLPERTAESIEHVIHKLELDVQWPMPDVPQLRELARGLRKDAEGLRRSRRAGWRSDANESLLAADALERLAGAISTVRGGRGITTHYSLVPGMTLRAHKSLYGLTAGQTYRVEEIGGAPSRATLVRLSATGRASQARLEAPTRALEILMLPGAGRALEVI